MSPDHSLPPPEPGAGHDAQQGRKVALSRIRPSALWVTVAAAVAIAAAAAGYATTNASYAANSGSPAGSARISGYSVASGAAGQGQQPASASDGTTALGISLGSGTGAQAAGSPGAPAASTAISATGVSAVTYTATGNVGLKEPQGVSASNGTVYVSNTADSVVAAIKDGTTTIVTGSLENSGEAGDGGQASAATVSQPTGTAENANGDILIADTEDNVVREITPDGVIRLIAGTGTEGSRLAAGNPANSELFQPRGVAFAANGDVLIADTANNRVLAVTPAGKIGVVAGDGIAGYRGDNGPAASAELNQPNGLAVDGHGNVYIADAANNVIRRVDASTGVITTVAGDYAADQSNGGNGGDTGDGGPATQAELNDPQGIAIDGDGNLFIADTFNNAVRVVTPDGTISTLWTGQNTPYAIATDPSAPGTVYFADTSSSLIEMGSYGPSSSDNS